MSFNNFYFFTIATSSISCYLLPSHRYHAITGMACLTGSILIDKLYRWVAVKYGDKKRTVDILDICSKLGHITLLGYASSQFYLLSTLHAGIAGYFHYASALLLNLSSKITFYSTLVGLFCMPMYLFIGPFVNKVLTRFANALSLSERDATLVRSVLEKIKTGQYVSISYRGVKIFSTSPRTPLTEEELNKIAPARCPGLGNVPEQVYAEFSVPDKCAVCMDAYSEKELTRTLPCKHSFHAACIDQWLLQSTPVCAICRQVIEVPADIIGEQMINMVGQ